MLSLRSDLPIAARMLAIVVANTAPAASAALGYRRPIAVWLLAFRLVLRSSLL